MGVRHYDPILIARQFLFVRESAEQNHGLRVEGIQKWCGGSAGESWCGYFLTMVLDIAYQGAAPILRTGSCDEIWAVARKEGWIITQPAPGDIYLRVRNGNDAHHVGFIVSGVPASGQFVSLSGNTNTDGSSNGIGVFENPVVSLSSDIFIHLPE